MFGSIGFKVIKKKPQTKILKWSIPFILNEGGDMFGWIKRLFKSKKSEERINELVDHDATTWDLNFQELNNDDVTLLAEALKENDTLTSLNLSNNEIGHEEAIALAQVLRVNDTLTELYHLVVIT